MDTLVSNKIQSHREVIVFLFCFGGFLNVEKLSSFKKNDYTKLRSLLESYKIQL